MHPFCSSICGHREKLQSQSSPDVSGSYALEKDKVIVTFFPLSLLFPPQRTFIVYEQVLFSLSAGVCFLF